MKKFNVEQLEFPGFKLARLDDEEPPRLVVETQVKIKDTYTGETVTFKMPGETDRPDMVHAISTNAIEHTKTKANIESFCKGREGAMHEEEQEEHEEDEKEVFVNGKKETRSKAQAEIGL